MLSGRQGGVSRGVNVIVDLIPERQVHVGNHLTTMISLEGYHPWLYDTAQKCHNHIERVCVYVHTVHVHMYVRTCDPNR